MNLPEYYDSENMSQEEAFECIEFLFDGYKTRRRKKDLYHPNDPVPRMIIGTYYRFIENPDFEEIFASFKKNYITNENRLEEVTKIKEKQGLGIVYDYIQSFDVNSSMNVYTLLKLHQLLFSKAPHPECAGSLRTYDVYLPNTGITVPTWTDVPKMMQQLYFESLPLFQEGKYIRESKDMSHLIPYIDRCIELNCKLIQIQPFVDGNKRTSRALMNLMFKTVNIPPVYVKISEAEEYGRAMNKAINEQDYTDIKTFYYYKICDSIYELGIKPKKDLASSDPAKTMKK